MRALSLGFDGFFQCRLPTDNDHFTHPRGDIGWTHAHADEPDLDRIIRFWDPVAPRSYIPPIGVAVRRVELRGDTATSHPLIGARVELSPDAFFEGRDDEGTRLTPDAKEPIRPMLFRIHQGATVIQRQSDYDIMVAAERRPYMGKGFTRSLPDAAVRGTPLTTIEEAQRFREQRAADLRRDLAEASPRERAIIEGRLSQLQRNGADDIRVVTLVGSVQFAHPLKDAATINDPARLIGVPLDTTTPWNVEYWMGSWDTDTLTGFVRGTLTIPIQ